MPVAVQWLDEFNADFESAYGRKSKHFFCPILLRDEPAPLCNGHILCDGFVSASGLKVPQREDVDSFFGMTIEPDLIKFLNHPLTSTSDLLKGAGIVEIEMPDGSKADTFFAKKKTGADAKFQRIGLLDESGKEFTSRMLRDKQLDPRAKHADVSWETRFKQSFIDAALLKCGYLAMFRLLKYHWVRCSGASTVRRALKRLIDSNEAGHDLAKVSFRTFRQFGQSSLFLGSHSIPGVKDSLENSVFLVHQAPTKAGMMPFALSCIFSINEGQLLVTLPGYESRRVGYGYYRHFLRNRLMTQETRVASLKGGKLEFSQFTVDLFPIETRPAGA